jgi:uncharacterized membrane protein
MGEVRNLLLWSLVAAIGAGSLAYLTYFLSMIQIANIQTMIDGLVAAVVLVVILSLISIITFVNAITLYLQNNHRTISFHRTKVIKMDSLQH